MQVRTTSAVGDAMLGHLPSRGGGHPKQKWGISTHIITNKNLFSFLGLGALEECRVTHTILVHDCLQVQLVSHRLDTS